MLKLKLDAEGKAIVQEGKPVYTDDTGKDVVFDADHAVTKIAQLNGESKGHREAKEAAEAKLVAFKDITDPVAAAKAVATLKNIDDKTLVDAGKVEEIKLAAIKATEEKFAPYVEQAKFFETALYDEKIGGAFARSSLIAGDKATLSIPADMVQARFGKHFSMKDGKVIATDHQGNQIYSKARPGDAADFDEALGFLVDQYPHRDSILKSSGASGGGSGGNQNGNNASGKKEITRAEFDAMAPLQKAAAASSTSIVG